MVMNSSSCSLWEKILIQIRYHRRKTKKCANRTQNWLLTSLKPGKWCFRTKYASVYIFDKWSVWNINNNEIFNVLEIQRPIQATYQNGKKRENSLSTTIAWAISILRTNQWLEWKTVEYLKIVHNFGDRCIQTYILPNKTIKKLQWNVKKNDM